MKKIISIILSVTMLTATAALAANAATADTEYVSAKQYRYEVISETTLPNNVVKTYSYGFTQKNNPNSEFGIISKENRKLVYYFKSQNSEATKVEKNNYKAFLNYSSTSLNLNFENTGGVYQLIKFNLNDFHHYFNKDGTSTQVMGGYTHDYNFTLEEDGNRSHLVIVSGGYINFVAPDKDGYVKAYIYKKLGGDVKFVTDFQCVNNWSGGGISGISIAYLLIGNADVSLNKVIVDDVTAIQSYSAGIDDFNKLQKRNADVNFDGKIDVDDATMVQKYLAGML